MLQRFILPKADVGSGISPSSGAQLFFYEPGTSTFKETFTDVNGIYPSKNPVEADSTGVFDSIYLDGTYKVILKDKDGVQIWEEAAVQYDYTFDSASEAALEEFKADAASAIDGLSSSVGWEILGDFAIGEEITAQNQVLQYDGGLWRTTEVLPYTTTGDNPTSGAEAGKWVVVASGELESVAKVYNVDNSSVIYTTNTTTVLDDVEYLYDSAGQKTYKIPGVIGDGEYISSVIGGVLETTGGTYLLTEIIPISSYNLRENATTTEDITYYISPSTDTVNPGSDLNDGLTSTTPFATIQKAIDLIPLYIKHAVVIDLSTAPGDASYLYDEDVYVKAAIREADDSGQAYGSYSVNGDGATTKVKSVTVVSSCANVYNFEIQQPAPLISSESGGVAFWYCSAEAGAREISYAVGFGGTGILAFASNVEARTINFDNTTKAIRSKRGGKVQARFCLGEVGAVSSDPVYDTSELSTIVINDNTLVTKSGGAWYDADQGCRIDDNDKGVIITGAYKTLAEMSETSLKITKPNPFNNSAIKTAKVWGDRTAVEVGGVNFQWSADSNTSSGWTHNAYRGVSGWQYASNGFVFAGIYSASEYTIYYAAAGIEDDPVSLEAVLSVDKPTVSNTTGLTIYYYNGSSLVERRVRVGAADSGGTGFRMLTISN